MSRYVLRHVDAAGTVHAWTCGEPSAHWVARWHARDSGRPTEVWRDGVLVTTWTVDGPDPVAWPDDFDDEPPCVRGLPCDCDDAPCGPLYATEDDEQGCLRGTGCTDPSEAVSEGCEGPVWVQPVINYAAL
jgi:hypothetical protein